MIMPHVTSSRRLNLGLLVVGLIAALIANTSAYSHQLGKPALIRSSTSIGLESKKLINNRNCLSV